MFSVLKLKKILSLISFVATVTSYGQIIVIPETPSPEEQHAANELQEHLQIATNSKIQIVPENQVGKDADGNMIFIGLTQFAAENGLEFKELGKEEWNLKSVGRKIVLGGGKPRGTLYAVYEFLERYCGVMWLDEHTTHIPKLQTWPEKIDIKGKPAFEVRGLYAYFREPQNKRRLYMARNRQNLFHDEGNQPFLNSLEIHPVFGSPRECHTYYNYTKEWGADLEDCFSLSTDGKRLRAQSASGPGQVCFSNQKCIDLFTAKLEEFIQADRKNKPQAEWPIIYEISANDNESKCVCENCLALAKKYDSYGGTVLAFTNAIAARIKNKYPEVYVEMFAYGFSEIPPKGIRAEKNVLIRVAQLGSEFGQGIRDTLRPLTHPNNIEPNRRVQEWSQLGQLAVWDYWTMYVREARLGLCTAAIAANLPLYEKLGVRSVFVEAENPLNNIFYALRLWLGLRMLNNPSLDAKNEIKRFMTVYYGAAAAEMLALHDYIEKRESEIKGRLNDVALRHRQDLDDAFFAEAERLFAVAWSRNETPEITKRLAKERACLNSIRLERRAELLPFELTKLGQQIRDDLKLSLPDWTSSNKIAVILNELDTKMTGINLMLPTPAELAEREVVVDLTWPQLYNHYQSKIIEVADAAGGRAVVLKKGDEDKGLLQFGLYDVAGKREIKTSKIPLEENFQDEKFHLYNLGKVTLTSKCYAWAHYSWNIQRPLSEFYQSNGISNEYDLYFSIKVQGPAYVKDSLQENAIMLDRILLVR
ncbi:MAG: DUF4838 domain-containing protein [Lentisphaeria bacterium]